MVHRKSWGHIVAIVILGLAVLCTPARAQVFSPPKSISNNSIDSHGSFTPQIAVDFGGNINAVWEDDTASNSNILFSRSTDGGATFFPTPMKLSNSLGCSFNPVMAVDVSANINVVWQDSPDCRFRTSNIFFSRSTDGGITFSAPMNLSETIISAFYSIPQIAVAAGNISVVWESDTGNLGIWFRSSSDGGATFSEPKMLSTNTGGSIDPQIAVDKSGNINVVWEDDIAGHSDISFRRSTDGGATFFPILNPKNLSNPNGSFIASAHSPRIAADLSGNINVVWAGTDPIDFNTDIFFSRSTDGGATFFPIPKNLSNNTVLFGDSSSPQTAVDLAGNINVVWEAPDITPDTFFARSGDGGATFSTPPPKISNDLGSSFNARLALDANGNINVAWEDNTGNRDIFFTRSTGSGTSFSTIVNLSNDSGLSLAAQMAADKNGNLNVVWQDNTPGISQIFFSRLPADVGANQPPTIVTPPANQTVTAGQTATFSVTASGTAPLSYQWQENGADISGATSASYTAPATTAQDNGAQFRVMVSNTAGSATSGMATLTVQSPPVADAGPDQTVESTGTGGTLVKLDGSKSSDPDKDVLSFIWMDEAGNVVGSKDIVPLTLSLGTYTFTLKVTDPGGLSSTDTTVIKVQTVNRPPVADAGADQILECAGGIRVILNGSKSSDPDGDVLSFVWKDEAGNAVGTAAVVQLTPTMGNHAFTLTVTDPGGLRATATTLVTVRDTVTPTLRVMLSPDTLWSPNHKLVQITATVETSDSCDPNPAVTLVSITSNEPDNGLGDGDQPNDIQAVGGGLIPFGTDVRSFLLRAERSGMGTGRVYTVNYMVRDAAGNESLASAQVSVGSQTTEASPNRSGRKK